MTTPTTTEPRWCGWFRERRGAWRIIIPDAPSLADCWGQLLAAVAGLPTGDALVLESFRCPGDPPPAVPGSGRRRQSQHRNRAGYAPPGRQVRG